MWHIHNFLHRCVCFAKASKAKSIFGGTVQSLDLFFKSPHMAENVLQIQEASGQAAESCKPFQDYKSDSEWLEGCRLFHHFSPWGKNLVLLIGFYNHVIWTLAQRGCNSYLQSKPEHTFSTLRWWLDPIGTQWHRAGRFSGRCHFLAAQAYKWIEHRTRVEASWK